MNPVSEDIKDKLVELGIGTYAATTGWGIFTVEEPDKPDTAITIYNTPGRAPGYYANRSLAPTHYSNFQVRVRGTTDATTWAKLEEVMDGLSQIGHFDIVTGAETMHYANILMTTEPIFLEKDEERKRFIWVANFIAFREQK